MVDIERGCFLKGLREVYSSSLVLLEHAGVSADKADFSFCAAQFNVFKKIRAATLDHDYFNY